MWKRLCSSQDEKLFESRAECGRITDEDILNANEIHRARILQLNAQLVPCLISILWDYYCPTLFPTARTAIAKIIMHRRGIRHTANECSQTCSVRLDRCDFDLIMTLEACRDHRDNAKGQIMIIGLYAAQRKKARHIESTSILFYP